MNVSYKKLWHLLLDKDMTKTELMQKVGMSASTLAKMSKNEPVSMSVLSRICSVLDCNVDDIVEFPVKEEN